MRRAAQHALVIACYALIAFLALYNLVFHVPGFVAGTGYTDFYHFHWNYWWIRHALITPGLSVYETNYVLAPFTSSLALHTLTPFWYPVWALFEPLGGTTVAMSGVYLLAFTLAGHSFYLLLRREGAVPGLALVGGAALELAPTMFTAAFWTNVNIMAWFWLPALILLWGQVAYARRRVAWTLALAVALWAMLLTDLQHPLFAVWLVGPYALLTLRQAPNLRERLGLLSSGAIAVVGALVLLWIAGPLPGILVFDTGTLALTPASDAVALRFPDGLLWHVTDGTPRAHLALVGVVLALVVGGKPHPRPADAGLPLSIWRGGWGVRWFWLALAIAPLLLSFGASVTVAGVEIPLPYALLHPVLGGMFRYPERFLPVFLIPAVLFTALTLTPLLRGHLRAALVASALALLAVIGAARTFSPLPVQPAPRPYDFYAAMGSEPYDYVVVEVPTGGSSGQGIVGTEAAQTLQFYGITHGKRMVNGHISRVNTWHFWHMRTDDAMLAWLGQRRWLEPELVEAQLRERIYGWPIGYIVVHQDLIGREGPTAQEIIGYFNSLPDLLCPVWVEGDAVAYRSAWHPDGCPPRTPPEVEPGAYLIDIGAAGDERYIGWGWHWPEDVGSVTWRWTGEHPQTRLYVDLPPGAYTLTLTMQAFYEARQITVSVDNAPLSTVTVGAETLSSHTFDIPDSVIGDGQHVTLTLDYDAVIIPAEVGQSADPRQLAVAVDAVRFDRLD